MISKKEIVENIQSMPEEEFDSIDVILERLVLLDKIRKGLDDIENGRVYSDDEVKKQLGI